MPMYIKIDVNAQGRVFAKTRYSASNDTEFKDNAVAFGNSPEEVLRLLAKQVREKYLKPKAVITEEANAK